MIDNDALNQFMEVQIKSVLKSQVDSAVQEFVSKTIDNLILDPAWLNKIETLVQQSFRDQVANAISGVDLNAAITEQIDKSLDRWQEKLRSVYRSGGIIDSSKSPQLTVMDGCVVVESDLISKTLSVEQQAEIKGTLTVDNLVLRHSVNTDNQSWNELSDYVADRALEKINQDWKQQLIEQVLALSSQSGIDFDSITVHGQPLLEHGKLATAIKDSNLETVGTLKSLSVKGNAAFNDTMWCNKHRVGINTETPDMALSVWDEEVSISVGKYKQNQAWLGTSRAHALVLGTNRVRALEIDETGLTWVKKLRVDRWVIGHETEVPGYSGTRGDFVFNSDPKPGSPFAWVCLGGFKWQSLSAAT